MESVDTLDLKSNVRKDVRVQVPSRVQSKASTSPVGAFYFNMETVYILHSKSIDLFYMGSCLNFTTRLSQHNKGEFDTLFTHRDNDWKVLFVIEDLDYQMARNIEQHIKAMKSGTYYLNLKKYPEISEKLILKYSAGSSR